MDSFLATLTALPPGALWLALGVAAAIENVVPPFPADVAVAFGALVAARGDQSMVPVLVAAWAGNVVGAIAVYAAAARYGAARFERFLGRHVEEREARFRTLIGRYGIAALFFARFIPGVRALVPAVAGALKLPPFPAAVMLMAASAIWYGTIIVIAYRVDEWSRVQGELGRAATAAGIVAAAVIVVGTVVWLIARSRRPR